MKVEEFTVLCSMFSARLVREIMKNFVEQVKQGKEVTNSVMASIIANAMKNYSNNVATSGALIQFGTPIKMIELLLMSGGDLSGLVPESLKGEEENKAGAEMVYKSMMKIAGEGKNPDDSDPVPENSCDDCPVQEKCPFDNRKLKDATKNCN